MWKLILNLLLFTAIISTISFFLTDSTPKLQPNTGLILTISGDIVEEQAEKNQLQYFLELFSPPQKKATALSDILSIIDHASTDDRISYMIMDLKNLGKCGLNQLQAIGERLNAFKSTGKKIITKDNFYSQKSYYLAAHSSKIFMNPMGVVDLHGFGVYNLYFKEVLNKLKVNFNIFRVGTYKSAVEPIMRNSMSDEDKAQNKIWLSTLWQSFTKDITQLRNLPPNAIDSYINNIVPNLKSVNGDIALLAQKKGLIDDLKTSAQIEQYIVSNTLKYSSNSADIKNISSIDYLRLIRKQKRPAKENQIGIITVQGMIFNGDYSPEGNTNGDDFVSLLKSANNKKLKGLVVRINSGGGSAFASEQIRQALLEFKKTGKPIVVSMSTVAASGGYWIAADANEILAAPTTITGSIGVFGAIPTFEKTLAEIGIRKDGIGTTGLSSRMDLAQPLSPMLKDAIQQSVNHYYTKFINIIAKGRNINISNVEKNAQGLVFTGIKAKELGLVDKLGNLEDAVKSCASLAGLDDYETTIIRKQDSIKSTFTKSLSVYMPTMITKLIMPTYNLINFNDPNGVYAHCLTQPYL